jgi:DNA gyrase subunit A
MNELGLVPGRPYKKSATVGWRCPGQVSPARRQFGLRCPGAHGAGFALRYPLIDGQGNYGTIDDNAAAYRYTEARLTPVALTMLEDIDKNTVDFQPNFDDRLREPTVLPPRFPICW